MSDGEESAEERLAREVASMHLGACITHHDDGSKDGMPDACITYPEGRLGWLEVVRDTDGRYLAQQRALDGHDVSCVGDLRWAWLVHVRHRVRINPLRGWLVPMLQRIEASSGDDLRRTRDLVDEERVRDEGQAKRGKRQQGPRDVTYATPLLDMKPGKVVVRSAAFSHAHSTGELSGWVHDFFTRRHHDIAKKMNADRREEQHAFVWASPGSGPEQAHITAQRGLPFRPPPEDPPLPDGITHLWIAGSGSADRAIAWFPDRGWHDVPGHWTQTPKGRAMLVAAGRPYLGA